MFPQVGAFSSCGGAVVLSCFITQLNSTQHVPKLAPSVRGSTVPRCEMYSQPSLSVSAMSGQFSHLPLEQLEAAPVDQQQGWQVCRTCASGSLIPEQYGVVLDLFEQEGANSVLQKMNVPHFTDKLPQEPVRCGWNSWPHLATGTRVEPTYSPSLSVLRTAQEAGDLFLFTRPHWAGPSLRKNQGRPPEESDGVGSWNHVNHASVRLYSVLLPLHVPLPFIYSHATTQVTCKRLPTSGPRELGKRKMLNIDNLALRDNHKKKKPEEDSSTSPDDPGSKPMGKRGRAVHYNTASHKASTFQRSVSAVTQRARTPRAEPSRNRLQKGMQD